MVKARAFFYVCAGLFLLALAFHIGVRSATAQGVGTILGGNVGYASGWATGVVGRTYYFKRNNSMEPSGSVPEPVPGTAEVVATGGGAPAYLYALLANGDIYSRNLNEASWLYYGNLIGGPTPAQVESWGAVKSRFRGQPQVTPTDR